MEIHQKISMPNCQKLKHNGKEKYRSQTSIAKLWRQARENGNRSKGNKWSRRRKRHLLPVERKKPVFERETSAVSGKKVTIVPKNQNTLPPRLPSHPSHEVEVCRRKEVSKAKVTMVPFSDYRADIIWKGLARDRLVNIGILPNVNFTKQKRDGQENGVPKACPVKPACVQTFFLLEWHMQGGEGRINALPWYCPVGVAKTSSETQRRKNRAARKGKWSPRGTGNRQAPLILELRPGNRQRWWKRSTFRWDGRQPGQDRRLPGVVTHSRL